MGTSASVSLMARRISSESFRSMYFMSGKPRRLIVSCRCTRAMTRLFRARSIRLSRRNRLASSIFWRMTGCNAESMKNSQRISPILIGPPMRTVPRLPRCVLVPPDARVALPAAQQRRQDEPHHEPADVRPPRHAAGVSDHPQRDRATHQLHQEPDAKGEHRGQLNHRKEEQKRNQREHPRGWKQDEKCPEQTADGAAGSHRGDGRGWEEVPLDEGGDHARQQIEGQVAQMAEPVLDVVAEDPE